MMKDENLHTAKMYGTRLFYTAEEVGNRMKTTQEETGL